MNDLYECCHRYLASLNCTLWGRAFNIKDEDLEEAALWLAEMIREVDRERES